MAPCGPRAIPPYSATSPLPHILLSFSIFSFFPFLIYVSSIFLLFIPSHSARIVPLRFHARLNVALVLFVLILCYMVFLVKDACLFVLHLIYFCLVVWKLSLPVIGACVII